MTTEHNHPSGSDTESHHASFVIRVLRAARQVFGALNRQPSTEQTVRHRPIIAVRPPELRPAPPPKPDQDADQVESQVESQVEVQTGNQPGESPPPPAAKRLPNPKMIYKGQRRRTHRSNRSRPMYKDVDLDDDQQPAK